MNPNDFSTLKKPASIEAFIDFEEDESDVKSDLFDKIVVKAQGILESINSSLENGQVQLVTQEGFKLALVGPPNSGKSTLMNKLSKRKVAIVSDEPGTTRDILSINLNLAGFYVTIYDMAGIRETPESPVEKIGIDLAW